MSQTSWLLSYQNHIIQYHDIHDWLKILLAIEGPLSFFLSLLPTYNHRFFHFVSFDFAIIFISFWNQFIKSPQIASVPFTFSLKMILGLISSKLKPIPTAQLSHLTHSLPFFFLLLILKYAFWFPYTPFDLTRTIREYWRHHVLI